MLSLKFKMLPRESGVYGLINNWCKVADDVGINIELDLVEEIPDVEHPIPARARTSIEVEDKKVLLDGQDCNELSNGIIDRIDEFDLVVKCQYTPGNYNNARRPVSPFVYYTVNHDACMQMRPIRQYIMASRKFTHSIMWAGTCTGMPTRKAAKHFLKDHGKHTWVEQAKFDNYLELISNSVAGMVIRGRGYFCHREMELMCIGTPFISKMFKNIMRTPLIPWLHYYTDNDPNIDIESLCDRYLNYFEDGDKISIPSGEEWDRYVEISNYAMRWYDNNASPKASLAMLLEILEENNII